MLTQLNPTLHDQTTKCVYQQLSFQNTSLNWCPCTGISTLLPNYWELWLPVPIQAAEFPFLHQQSLPHTPLPLAFPCSWLNPFISATCSTFPIDYISLFFLSHFLIKIYFFSSILWPCLSYFWAWWGFTHWQQSQNQLWALVLLKDIAQMENLAAFVSKEKWPRVNCTCLVWEREVLTVQCNGMRQYPKFPWTMGSCGSQNSHVVDQAQPAAKVCAGSILLLGKEIKVSNSSRADPSWSQAVLPPGLKCRRSLLSAHKGRWRWFIWKFQYRC